MPPTSRPGSSADGFTRTFASTLTGNHTYTFPDASGTIALIASSVPSIAGTAGQVLVNGATTAVTGSAVTLSLATALVSVNSITSVALSPLVLATGTTGTAISIASATNIVTLFSDVVITKSTSNTALNVVEQCYDGTELSSTQQHGC